MFLVYVYVNLQMDEEFFDGMLNATSTAKSAIRIETDCALACTTDTLSVVCLWYFGSSLCLWCGEHQRSTASLMLDQVTRLY